MKGYLYIFAAATLWGFIGPFSRVAFQEGVSSMEVAFWRAVLAWGFFGIHAIIKREVKADPRDIPMLVVFGVTGVTLFYGSYLMSVDKGGAALAAVLLYTAPAWVTLLSRPIYKEPLTVPKLIALALTILGVIGVSMGAEGAGSGVRIGSVAILAGLASGFCYAMYYIIGKHFSDRYSAPNLFFYILPIGAVCLAPWVTFTEKSPVVWASLLFISGMSTYGAFYCYYMGIKRLEVSRASIAATLEPVVAAMVAYFWWGDFFTYKGYAGSFLILLAVLLVVVDGARERK